MEKKYWIYLQELWQQNWLLIVAWLTTGLLFWLLCITFQQSIDPVWVYMILSFFALIIYFGFYLRRLHDIKHLLLADHFNPNDYPYSLRNVIEKLKGIEKEKQEILSNTKKRETERQDYFSLWAHQVKLPLSAIDLQLQLEKPNLDEIKACEKRIQDYVSQAMTYVRLDGSDYRIRNIQLEEVIRPLLRENASIFIAHHISIKSEFSPTLITTDKKWISFVIEQLLSNALKYSPDGSTISITTQPNLLTILDEGCGIAIEDLPRIFEKGFTGKNGHQNIATSSGFGLYLCEKICKNLGCTLVIDNRNDSKQGVKAEIHFPKSFFLGD